MINKIDLSKLLCFYGYMVDCRRDRPVENSVATFSIFASCVPKSCLGKSKMVSFCDFSLLILLFVTDSAAAVFPFLMVGQVFDFSGFYCRRRRVE
jgi:hypothetical protein